MVAGLSCITVFCTTYALILPAITLESGFYCDKVEHTHSEDCYTKTLVCQMEDGSVHTHSESCYESIPAVACGKEEEEPHTHSDLCYTQEMALTCGQEEADAHTHSDDCYETVRDLICQTEESQEHTHSDSCYQETRRLICQLPEGEGHSHGDSCYTPTGNSVLSCGKEETEGHTHTDACMEPEKILVCALEENAPHAHTDECYEDTLSCELEEHTHTLSCRCNPGAVETSQEWEATLPRHLSGVWADDLLAVAKSQLGYREQEDNFTVSEDGDSITGYYTRYGDWYGMPYEAWCAMFVSFCLNYAEIPQQDFPREASVSRWVEKLSGNADGYRGFNLFRKPQNYDPIPGDLVFFDTDGDKKPCHVGIVTEFTPAGENAPAILKTIEGNYGDSVQEVTRALAEPEEENTLTVFGYASLPEKPMEEPVETVPATDPSETIPDGESRNDPPICGKEAHIHTDACYGPEDEAGNRPILCGMEAHAHTEECYAPLQREYRYEDDSILVSVVLPADSQVPATAQLRVTPITQEESRYALLEQQAQVAVDGELRQLVLYDLSFYTEEEEYLPVEESALVTITFKQDMLSPFPEQVTVLHYAQEDAAPLALSEVEIQRDERDTLSGLSFQTDGFSVFGVASSSAYAVYSAAPATVTLYPGQVYITDAYTDSPTISSGDIVSGVTAPAAQILKTGTDAGYTGSRADPSDALYTFTGDSTNGFTVAHGSVYLRISDAGCPNSTTAGSILFQDQDALADISEPGAFAIYSDTAGKYLFFHCNAATAAKKFSFDQQGAYSDESCRFHLYRLAADGEASSKEIPGYVQVTSLAEIQSGREYLIAAGAQNGVNYLLYPSTGSNRYTHAAEVSPYILTLTAKKAGTATVTVGAPNLTVSAGASDLTVNVTDEIHVEAGREAAIQLPAGATVTSADPTVAAAACDENGLVTLAGKAKGTTQAEVTVGEDTYTWNITVEPRTSFRITYGDRTLTIHLQDKSGAPLEAYLPDIVGEAATKYVFVGESFASLSEGNVKNIVIPQISGYQYAHVQYNDQPVSSVATPGYAEEGMEADNEHFRFFSTEPPAENGYYTVSELSGEAYLTYEEGPITTTVSPTGTVINLFDYWVTADDEGQVDHQNGNGDKGINAGHALKFNDNSGDLEGTINKWTGSNDYANKGGVLQGIVAKLLGADGFPVLSGDKQPSGSSEESLAYLFAPDYSGESSAYRRAYSNVGNLLQIDSQGYYYYDSKANYAEYDPESNRFHLYSDWAVGFQNKNENKGEFFPFNPYSTVDQNTDASNKKLNHFFGLTMTTRFIQQYDGHTDAYRQTDTTFEFSGDDDVWIFIDGVLAADLGGIHDAAGVTINFAKGTVEITRVYAGQQNVVTPFSKIFDQENLDVVTGTLKNGTYHTLKFYYLERGGNASNLKLKYNLVTYPVSGITKVDQVGNPVQGAHFSLYQADENYNIVGGAPLYSGTTGENGEFVFMNGDEPVSIQDLKEKSTHFILRETAVPSGYRGTGSDIFLKIKESGNANADGSHSYVFVCENTRDSGSWAASTLQVNAPQFLKLANQTEPQHFYNPADRDIEGTLFGVVLKYIGPEGSDKTLVELGKDENWAPIYGSSEKGYTIVNSGGSFIGNAILAAKQYSGNENFFRLASSGAMQATLTDLPGSIDSYYFIAGANDPQNIRYTVGYYWSSAGSISEVSESNTYRVQVYTESDLYRFTRTFGTSIKVPNLVNRIAVQKVDEAGSPLNGATFAMYQVGEDASKAVTGYDPYYFIARDGSTAVPVYLETDADLQFAGTAVLGSGETGSYQVDSSTGIITVTAGDSTYTIHPIQVKPSVSAAENSYKEDGIAEFERMSSGKYIIRELTAPDGYTVNHHHAMVLVTDRAIYANAGTEDDGISVSRGPGYLAANLHTFASLGDIDNTLTWVYTQMKVSPDSTSFGDVTAANYENWNWVTQKRDGTHTSDSPLTAYLKYITPTGDSSQETSARFSYAVDDDIRSHVYSNNIALSRRLFTRTGWSYLEIYQNYDWGIQEKGSHAEYEDWRYVPGSNNVWDDLSNLFSRSVYIHISDKEKTGDLAISKTVENAPEENTGRFDFQVDLYNGTQEVTVDGEAYTVPAPLSGSFSCTVKNEDGTVAAGSPGTISCGDTVTLENGQTALLEDLPYGTSYAVTEKQEYRLSLYEIKNSGTRQLVSPLSGDCQYTVYQIFQGKKADGTSASVRLPVGSAVPFPNGNAVFSLCANQAVEITRDGKVICEIVSGGEGAARIASTADGITATLTASYLYATSAKVEAQDTSSHMFQIGQAKTVAGEALYWENVTNVRFTNTYLPGQGLQKVRQDDPDTFLSGAEFTLSQTVNGEKYYYTPDHGWMIAKGAEAPLPVLVSNGGGKISLRLPDGKYTLTETKAPAGYQKLAAPVEITVKDGKITKAQMGETNLAANGGSVTLVIPNAAGHELPMSGGMGTERFYILGGLLAVFAGVLLVAKRRMRAG